MYASSCIHHSPHNHAFKQLPVIQTSIHQHHNLSTNLLVKFVPTSTLLFPSIHTSMCKPPFSVRTPYSNRSQIKAAKPKQKKVAYLDEVQSVASNIIFTYTSVAKSVALFRLLIESEAVPEPVKTFFYTKSKDFLKQLFGYKPQLTITVNEWCGNYSNLIYEAVEVYLSSRINPKAASLEANKTRLQKSISLNMEKGEEVMDTFKDFQLKWQFGLIEPKGERHGYEKRYFKLMFNSRHKETVVNEYLPFILSKAKEFKEKERDVKLYTWDSPYIHIDEGKWIGVNLDHPVTFDKLAMEPKFKKSIIEDLDRFVRRRDYYKKVGKAWKRGYLLYGPPGTGKSSLIAAMANYLKFDVYDLELSSLKSNSQLRKVLLRTGNKSIIVIEDVDCSSQTLNRDADDSDDDDDDDDDDTKSKTKAVSQQFTLSGLLNIMDGLWSTCGDERIVVLTTNHKDKLDPALLRPGRMDMHIYMGHCTQEGFDVLVFNYLGLDDHRLFPDIKGLIQEVDVSPAEIAEHLMRNDDSDLALEGVLDMLKQKKNDKYIQDEEKEKAKKEKKTKND